MDIAFILNGQFQENFRTILEVGGMRKIMYINSWNMCSFPTRNSKHSLSEEHIYLIPLLLVCEHEFGKVETHVNWIFPRVCGERYINMIKSEGNSLGTLTISNVSCQRHQLFLSNLCLSGVHTLLPLIPRKWTPATGMLPLSKGQFGFFIHKRTCSSLR